MNPETAHASPRLGTVLSDELFRPLLEPAREEVPSLRMFVAGRWLQGERRMAIESPIDGGALATVPDANTREVADAVGAAHDARRAIRDLPGHQRIELFERAAELVVKHRAALEDALLWEAGKPAHDRKAEATACAERLRATHQEASRIYGEYLPGDWARDTVGKWSLVIREPLGVVACICPFNYPLFIPTAKIVPALLAGNTVVAKASSQTPLALLLFARILDAAGLPAGTFNVVTGQGASVGQALVTDPRVRMVSFTGSTDVGKKIHGAGGLKKYHLELGGKGHALVFDDADVPDAAAKCVEGAFKNAGQRCDAVSVVVVVDAAAPEFETAAAAAASQWTVGDPRNAGTKVGPLITESAAQRVEALVRDATANGARVLAGGTRNGLYFEPTVLADVTPEMRLAREETFGPVLPIVRARDEAHAIQVAAKTPFGLDACVFTRNFERMWRAAKGIGCGEITVNDLPRHGVGHFPFGGQRESGQGREGIGYSIEEMTELKTVVFTLAPRPRL